RRVVSIVPVSGFPEGHSILMITRRGYMKKVPLGEFDSITRRGIIAIGLEEGDSLLDAQLVRRGQEVIVATKLGMAVRVEENVVRDMGRSARGVHGPKLEEGDEIVSLVIADSGEDSLLTVCEKGVGKRSKVADYRKTSTQRSKGVINTKITDKNGPVVACLAVTEEDEIMLMSASGMVIRSKVSEMREMGRGTVGVYLMDLEEGDKVVTVGKVAREDALQAREKAEAIRKDRAEAEGRASAPEGDAPAPQDGEPSSGNAGSTGGNTAPGDG
ncbi:MAG: DNA gyrase subunit A, partial [Planctomycetota bacterium]|nr:DNA gyrase subunit A [Planctomycetota bacterium]